MTPKCQSPIPVLATLLMITGCNSSVPSETPLPPQATAPKAVTKNVCAFRDTLEHDLSLAAGKNSRSDREKWLDTISNCLTSRERTLGDRYACLKALSDPRLDLVNSALDLRRKACALALDAARDSRHSDLTAFGLASMSIARTLGADQETMKELQALNDRAQQLDALFPAQFRVRRGIISASN